MLSSIHPLGERSRNNRWGMTATAFIVGAVAGGAVTGAVAGLIGLVASSVVSWSASQALLVLAALAIAAAVGDLALRGRPLPLLHRQVNEEWIARYRGWVYGIGFGFQLGLGVVTYITTFAVPVMLIAAALTGSPSSGALIGATFGVFRGLAILATWSVDDPGSLGSFHARMARIAVPVRGASAGAEAMIGAFAALVVGIS
jgi:hypothetical protein